MIKKDLFNRRKFDKNYNIIGDFDFFINLSLKENFTVFKNHLHTIEYMMKTIQRKLKKQLVK